MQIEPVFTPAASTQTHKRHSPNLTPSIPIGPITRTIDRARRHDAGLLASLHSARLRAAPWAEPGEKVVTSTPTWRTWRELIRVCAHPTYLRKTVTIALLVGTVLFAINQLDVVLGGRAT